MHGVILDCNSLNGSIMYFDPQQQSLSLANELVAEGRLTFTFDELVKRLGKSRTATANLLNRMEKSGLIYRVR